jgi:hypothetical protein
MFKELTEVINQFNTTIKSELINYSEKNEVVVTKYQNILSSSNNLMLSSWHNIVNDWHDFSNKSKQNIIQKINLQDIVSWHKVFLIDEKQNQEDGHNFNVFDLLEEEFNFRIYETMHSKLLKFFLDTRASHGQENRFLIEFLQLLGITQPGVGIWHVTAEQGKIDILLHRSEPESVIIIENKSNWANDQPNQLYRYWYNAIYSKTKNSNKEFYSQNSDRYKIVYLAPTDGKKLELHSITKPKDNTFYGGLPDFIPMDIHTLTFNAFVQDWLCKCKNKLPPSNYRIKEYITQYQMLCKKL